jgi:hypothetical protein
MSFIAPTDKTTGTVVTAAHWNQDVVENVNALFPDGATVDTWTPVLEATSSNPSTSSAVGRQYQMGAIMQFWGRFVISAAGSGDYFVALPAASVGLTGGGGGTGSIMGGWHARDSSTVSNGGGSLALTGADDVVFTIHANEASFQRVVTESVPWAWASGDVLTLFGFYPIA